MLKIFSLMLIAGLPVLASAACVDPETKQLVRCGMPTVRAAKPAVVPPPAANGPALNKDGQPQEVLRRPSEEARLLKAFLVREAAAKANGSNRQGALTNK